MKDIEPTKSRVLIEKVNVVKIEESPILKPFTHDPWVNQRTARVVKTGPGCTDVRVGDVIVLERGCGIIEQWSGGKDILIEEKEIAAKIDVDPVVYKIELFNKPKTIAGTGIKL